MKNLFLIVTVFIFSFKLSAQQTGPEVVASGGDYQENGGIKLSWTLGEIVTETAENQDVILTQGFQQSDFNLTSVEERISSEINVSIFPNPAKDYVLVDIKSKEKRKFNIFLIDVNGSVVKQQKVESLENRIQINISEFSNSLYFIKLIDEETGYANTYKIQKVK
jgi:hypothetical protein